jgi:hypothetical protein
MNKTFQLLLTCAVLFCFYACNTSEGPSYAIERPFKTINLDYDTFTLDASEPKVVRLANGSSIEIPENAFVDKNGKVVTGKVSLQYREFHTAADILTSGIPMLCNDENGETKPFESGGMFEIGATANGEEISIAKDKKINVRMASKVEGDFDFYYLEEDGGKKVETAALFMQTQAPALVEKQYRWKKIYSPTEEALKNSTSERENKPDAKYFEAHFDTQKYTEAAAIDTIKWEYGGIAKTDDPTDPSNAFFQKQVWNSVHVSKPVYYTKQVKQIQNSQGNGWNFGGITMLPDSLGFLAKDGIDYISYYGWDGRLKTRFKGVFQVIGNVGFEGFAFSHNNFLNKQQTHVLLMDKKEQCKLFSLEGTLIKDLGYLHHAGFDPSGTKIIGQFQSEDKTQYEVRVFSLQGTLLNKFSFDGKLEWGMVENYAFSSDYKNIAVVSKGSLIVRDSNGATLAVLPSKDIDKWYLSPYASCIFLYSEKYELSIWNWSKNTVRKPKYHSSIYLHDIGHASDPTLIINDGEKNYLWNWEKDTYVQIEQKQTSYYHLYFSTGGNFIYHNSYRYVDDNNREKKASYLMNKNGEIIKKFPAAYECNFSFNKNEDAVIVQADTNQLYLIDKKGVLLVDFKKYDSQINVASFDGSGNVLTSTTDGTVMLWNNTGKLLYTVQTGVENARFYIGSNMTFYSFDEPVKLWDFKTGELLYSFNDEFVFDVYETQWFGTNVMIPDYAAFSWGWSKGASSVLWEKTSQKLPSDVYQLSFKKDSVQFHTYTYLNQIQLKLLTKYQNQYDLILESEIKAKKKEQAERVEEEDKLVRSFAINNFGIYNWDRFYKDTNAVFVNAKMELDTSVTEFNDITFFLITGKDRNVVIKYYSSALDKFRFVPEDNNVLLAVLPNDRIALFDEEQFRKLDIAELKQKQTYNFKLKIIEGAASKSVLDRILQKPS